MTHHPARRTGTQILTPRVRQALALALTILASVALVAGPQAAAARDESEALKTEWTARHSEVTLEYNDASAALAQAQRDYRKARQRHRLQGERRVGLVSTLEAAKIRHAAAKLAMD